ncbi:MAG: hypothetical protein GY862_29155 [Gammaproteobacteria bacterium]|nr:hypothetical protein [Gammaproteobacteria bacterium]
MHRFPVPGFRFDSFQVLLQNIHVPSILFRRVEMAAEDFFGQSVQTDSRFGKIRADFRVRNLELLSHRPQIEGAVTPYTTNPDSAAFFRAFRKSAQHSAGRGLQPRPERLYFESGL